MKSKILWTLLIAFCCVILVGVGAFGFQYVKNQNSLLNLQNNFKITQNSTFTPEDKIKYEITTYYYLVSVFVNNYYQPAIAEMENMLLEQLTVSELLTKLNYVKNVKKNSDIFKELELSPEIKQVNNLLVASIYNLDRASLQLSKSISGNTGLSPEIKLSEELSTLYYKEFVLKFNALLKKYALADLKPIIYQSDTASLEESSTELKTEQANKPPLQ